MSPGSRRKPRGRRHRPAIRIDARPGRRDIAPMPSTSWGYRAAVRLGAALAPAIGLVDRKVGDGHRSRRGAVASAGGVGRGAPRRAAGRWPGSTPPRSAKGSRPRACCSSSAASCPSASSSTPTSAPRPSRWPAGSRSTRPTTCPTISPPTADRLLAALAPDLLVFAKLDLWPELATRAAATRRRRSPWWRPP